MSRPITLSLIAIMVATALPRSAPARQRSRSWVSEEVRYFERDFTRTFDFADSVGNTLSSLEDSRYDLLLFDTQFFTKVGKRGSIHIDAPYLIATAQGKRNDSGALLPFSDTAEGLRSITITPSYWVKDPIDPSGGHNLSLEFRINGSDTRLDPGEQQVYNFILEGGLGYLTPAWAFGNQVRSLFSSGTGITLSDNWTWRRRNKNIFDFSAAYTYNGTFNPVTNLPTEINGYDHLLTQAAYQHRMSPRKQITASISTVMFTRATIVNARDDSVTEPGVVRSSSDEGNSFLLGRRPDLIHDADLDFSLAWDVVHHRKHATRFLALYHLSGKQDILTTTGGVFRQVKPGDAVNFTVEESRRIIPGFFLNYGFLLGHIEATTAPGRTLPDTERTLATARMGFARSVRSGHNITAQFDFGLTQDTPSVKSDLRYSYAW